MFATASPLSARRLRRLLSLILLPIIVLTLFAPGAPRAQAQTQTRPPANTSEQYDVAIVGGMIPSDLNEHGQVVGTLTVADEQRAALWDNGQLTLLGPGPSRAGGNNDAGDVAITRGKRVFVRSASGVETEVTPEGQIDEIEAVGLNNVGTVLARVKLAGGVTRAALLQPGATTYLPGYYDDSAYPTALNDRDNASGYVIGPDSEPDAVYWIDGVLRFRGSYIGDQADSKFFNINNRDDVAGYIGYRTSAPPIRTFSLLADGYDSGGSEFAYFIQASYANDIAENTMTVGELVDESGERRAAAWVGGFRVELNERIPSDSGTFLERALNVNESGQILAEGRFNGVRMTLLLTPRRDLQLATVRLERQDRDSAAWLLMPGQVVPDGSPARIVAQIRNATPDAASVQLGFRNTTTGTSLSGCPSTALVPPTGSGIPFEVQCEIDTTGLAWRSGTGGTRHLLEITLTPPTGTAQTSSIGLSVLPRPLIFVPGIGGNYAAGNDYYWLTNRGVAPGYLEIDPLIRSYDGILRTLELTGYQRNVSLYIANYDWRVVPGPSDMQYDGVITGLTAAGVSDRQYQYGVDYFGAMIRDADEYWRRQFDSPLDYVDVIAHSTGGLVTRTYIQSTAYGATYDGPTGAELPKVRNFISVGVPHRGAGKAWNPLHDNWGIDGSFQAVLSKIANLAFQKLEEGATISGPDGAISREAFVDPATGKLQPMPFIKRYVPTINTLLATYPFLVRDPLTGERQVVHDGVFANHLVLDLNNGADINPSRDINAFLARTRLTAIGATSERTPLYVEQHFGPADDVLAPFTDFLKNDAEAGAIYFTDEWVERAGDGTVPTGSSVGLFIGDTRARVLTYARGENTQASVKHTDLLDNPQIQLDILRILDAPARQENLRAFGREDILNIISVIIDPVQGYVVDEQGRRLGWTEATGPLEEIPNSVWRGAGDGFGLIFGRFEQDLRLELRGLDGPYYAQVQRLTAEGAQGGVTLEGPRLARSETVRAPALLPSQPYTPQVRAGGPYTVAEGSSVQVIATGEAGLSYAWDLNGDGTFETPGQSTTFSAAGLDGPATRTATVRGILPTGQSATASAQVSVTNVAPTASLSAPATATVGRPFTLALTGASDPGGDPLQFAFDCGAGYGPLGASNSVSCTPTAAGTLTVRASVADDDGGVNTYSATLTVSGTQPQPNKPEVPLCYANGTQRWQDFRQGLQKNGKPVPPSRSKPELALGMPQRNDTVNFVSLGFGGSLTLRFANPLVNDGTSRADLRIWETSFGDANRAWNKYPEAARIEVSLDGKSWTQIGRTSDKDQAYDLVLPRAQFVRLTDISDPRRFGATDDGFDLDAIEALTGCAQP